MSFAQVRNCNKVIKKVFKVIWMPNYSKVLLIKIFLNHNIQGKFESSDQEIEKRKNLLICFMNHYLRVNGITKIFF